jgi:hypothetical protein
MPERPASDQPEDDQPMPDQFIVAEPGRPGLWSNSDIAARAAVSTGAIDVWRRCNPPGTSNAFPSPVAEVAEGPLYLAGDVATWLGKPEQARTRTPDASALLPRPGKRTLRDLVRSVENNATAYWLMREAPGR